MKLLRDFSSSLLMVYWIKNQKQKQFIMKPLILVVEVCQQGKDFKALKYNKKDNVNVQEKMKMGALINSSSYI